MLHLIASNFVGGPEKQILRHAEQDASNALEVVIGSFRDGEGRPEILSKAEALGIPTIELGSGHLPHVAVRELLKKLDEDDISILCTHGYKANLIGFLASKFTDCPHIAFVRGWTGENFRVRVYEAVERFVLRRTPRVVCVSRPQAERLAQERRHAALPRVIANAANLPGVAQVDIRALRAELGIATDVFVVSAAGRLSPEKGHRYLLDATKLLAARIPNLQVLLLGEGTERASLEAQCNALGLQGCVRLPGFQRDVLRWMRASDVVVNPSLTEGMPNVVLEAMSLGLPIVATDVGGVGDMLVNGESGLLIPAGDAHAIADAVFQLFADPDKSRALGRSANNAVQRFSPERQRDELLALYAETLGLAPDALQPPREPLALPFISVVIPVRNEEAHLGAVLDDLLQQDYPHDRFEIIVVDGNSTDGTSDVVRRHAARARVSVRLVNNPSQWSSAGRNAGILNSRGDVIAFIDGHCHILSPALLRDTAALLHETGAECLCRPQPLTTGHNTPLQDAIAFARASRIGHGLDSTIFDPEREAWVDPTSSGAVYRRGVFQRFGLYDEQFDACEDVEFNHRLAAAGIKGYISPRLRIDYQPRDSFRALLRQMMRYGRGRFRLARKHPGARSLGQLVPALFVTAPVLLALLAPWTHWAGWLLALGAAAYIALSLSVSISIAARKGLRYLKYLPFVYPIIHSGLGLGFMAEACRLGERRPASASSGVTNPVEDAGDALSETPSACAPQAARIGGGN